MQNNKGFGLIELVIAVIVVVVLIAAGYIFIQGMQEDSGSSDPEVATQTAEQHHESQNNDPMDDWPSYSFDKYGITFQHPQDWQVEVDTVENFQDQPNILIKDGSDQIVLGIYGYRDSACEEFSPTRDVEDQPGLRIGQYEAVVVESCQEAGRYIHASTTEGQNVIISTDFMDQPQKDDARMLLETVSGLIPSIVN